MRGSCALEHRTDPPPGTTSAGPRSSRPISTLCQGICQGRHCRHPSAGWPRSTGTSRIALQAPPHGTLVVSVVDHVQDDTQHARPPGPCTSSPSSRHGLSSPPLFPATTRTGSPISRARVRHEIVGQYRHHRAAHAPPPPSPRAALQGSGTARPPGPDPAFGRSQG